MMSRNLLRPLSLMLIFLASHKCHAQVVLTSNTTINAINAGLYHDQDIIVRGCTVTIDGAHRFRSLVVERSAANQPGVVTHSPGIVGIQEGGLLLETLLNVDIQGQDGALVASKINVSGKGFQSASGPSAGGSAWQAGGAGHGGAGGDSYAGLTGGDCEGSFEYPVSLGSGGGNDTNHNPGEGGWGGGSVRLIVGTSLNLYGTIEASGVGGTAYDAGGGAGGSIWIETLGTQGTGSITASGGTGSGPYSGGGGGGRIAFYSAGGPDQLQFRANGGNAAYPGGSGTIFIANQPGGVGTLLLDNAGALGETSEFYSPTLVRGDLVVRNGARIGPKHLQVGFDVHVTGNIHVTSTGQVYANARGFLAATGPGAGYNGWNAGGGGHGGQGGNGGGGTYGSAGSPVSLGSGGGHDTNHAGTGGRGGGALRLRADGVFDLNGSVQANGEGASFYDAGGGSGGSIWLAGNSITGSGSVQASGGSPVFWGGGGGGGRVAIFGETVSESITASAGAGMGGYSGSSGTVIVSGRTPIVRIHLTFADLAGSPPSTCAAHFRVNWQPNPYFLQAPVIDNGTVEVFRPDTTAQYVYIKADTWLTRKLWLTPESTDYTLVLTENGDCDGDNEVGISDYALLSASYGFSDGDPGYDTKADLNGDAAVDIADYAILSANYGEVGD